MKIGIVSTWKAKCGLATYAADLANGLKGLGLDVVILAEKKDVLPDGFDPDFETYGIPSIECWSRYENFEKLLEVVRKENIDVVHISHQFGLFPIAPTLNYLLSNLKAMGKKVIVTLHDVVPYNFGMLDYFQPLITLPDYIIVHNEPSKRLLVTDWMCSPEKVVKIWHGTKLVDIPEKDDAKTSLKISKDTKVILSWGFLWESKGVLPLLEGYSQIIKKYPNSMFIHAGGLHPLYKDTGYVKRLIATAMKLGIRPENFRITGFVPEKQVPTYFGAADVIVLNYHRGSISASGAAHRALAAHRVIVKTDDPCVAEVPGMMVSRGDTQGLFQAVLRVLDDPILQQELIEKADKFAEESSWARMALEHQKLYI